MVPRENAYREYVWKPFSVCERAKGVFCLFVCAKTHIPESLTWSLKKKTHIPQTVFDWWGSDGVGLEGAMGRCWLRPPLPGVILYSSLQCLVTPTLNRAERQSKGTFSICWNIDQIWAKMQFLQIEHVPQLQICYFLEKKSPCGSVPNIEELLRTCLQKIWPFSW